MRTLSAHGPQGEPAEELAHLDNDPWAEAVGLTPFGAKTLRTVSWPNPRVPTDAGAARARLKHMEPLQALAWLLLTSRADLKPLGAEEVDEKIRELLENTPREQFTEIKPFGYWVVDPLSEIAFTPSGDCERVRPVNADGKSIHGHKLPGDIGAWVTPQRLSSAEAARKPAHAQRINAISLAGLLIASDRFDVLERVEPLDIDPLKPAASLGFDRSDMAKSRNGFDIGEINGYAMALLAHANHFFQWINPWQELLKEHIGLRRNELTASLGLGLKTWSLAHGELGQTCAEMVCTMLQLGAMINEAGLSALCAQVVKSSGKAGPAAGFARLCAQMYLVDRQGIAAKRVLQSARAGGFSVTPHHGQAHPMVPYAQANLEEAVAVMLREGLDPTITDGMGKNVLQRAQSTRADRVVELLQTGRLPEVREPVAQAIPAQSSHQAPDQTPAPGRLPEQARQAADSGVAQISEHPALEGVAPEERLATEAESSEMDSQTLKIEDQIASMRGMHKALGDLMGQAQGESTDRSVVATNLVELTLEPQEPQDVDGGQEDRGQADYQAPGEDSDGAMRKNAALRAEKIVPKAEEVAAASFAVNSRIKPAARRRAALEELRAEFSRSKEHA